MTREELKRLIDESGIELKDIPSILTEVDCERKEKAAAERVAKEKRERAVIEVRSAAAEALTEFIVAYLACEGKKITQEEKYALDSIHTQLLDRLAYIFNKHSVTRAEKTNSDKNETKEELDREKLERFLKTL